MISQSSKRKRSESTSKHILFCKSSKLMRSKNNLHTFSVDSVVVSAGFSCWLKVTYLIPIQSFGIKENMSDTYKQKNNTAPIFFS